MNLMKWLAIVILLSATPVLGCTAILFGFTITVVKVNGAPTGKVLIITAPIMFTNYSGSNGGIVSLTVSSTGPFMANSVTVDGTFGSGDTGDLMISGIPTAAGSEAGTITINPFCGPFAGSPVSIGYNITAVGGVTPPTWGQNTYTAVLGEPVSGATGELFGQNAPDLVENSPIAFTFERYYASYLAVNNVTSALGTNWMHNYDVKLALNSAGTTATVTLFRGKTITFTKTGSNWQLSSTERLPYQLVSSGNGFQFMSPASRLIYDLDSGGKLTKVTDRNGNVLTVTQGATGPTLISDGLGHTLTFTYAGSNLIRVQDQAGRSVSFEYAGGILSASTDANGKRSSYATTSAGGLAGLITATTMPLGNKPFTQQYDSQGRVSTQSDSFANPFNFTYNPTSNGATLSVPGGETLTYTHDSQLNLTSQSDPSNASSTYTYDANNRPISVTDRLGQKTSVTWDASSGYPATITDHAGNKTSFKYSAALQGVFTFYDLVNVSFADGTSASYARDNKGNAIGVTDQSALTTQLTFNSRGQALTRTNASGGVTTFTYNSDGTLASVQLPTGDTTKIAYDPAGRPNLLTNPDGTTDSFQYDALGNILKATNPRGGVTTATIDDNNNPKTIVDPLSGLTTVGYDTNDHPISITDALGKTTRRLYDSVNRVKSVTDPTGVSVNFAYDTLNRPTSVLDATQRGLQLKFDAESRLLSATDALSRTVAVTRDSRGLVTTLTTPNNEKFSATYDALQRPLTRTDPLNGVTQLTYDARGLVSSLTLPGNVRASYTSNELGLVTTVTDPNGNAFLRAFDKAGRISSRTDPLGQTTSYQYDSQQRLSSTTRPLGTLQIQRDAAGNVTRRQYSDGLTLSYSYDPNNRITSADGLSLGYDINGRIVSSNGLQITRDDAGRISSITYAAGKTVKYTYDNRGLLTQVADWVGGVTTLTRDAAGQLTSTVYANGVREDATYDLNGRVSTAKVTRGSTSISSITLRRDALGRITGADRSAPSVPDVPNGYFPQAFDAASQSFAATYDANGRVVQDAVRGYKWDGASRLMSYQGVDGSASFTYDARGIRISRISGSTTENYVLDYATPLPTVAIVRNATADQRYYIWLPNGVLLETIDTGGARRFYHFDESGTTNFLTDDSGAVTDTYAVTPYGETLQHTGPAANPFTFQGAFGVMQEGATGLFYMRARYYDSTTARFLTRDPIDSLRPQAIDPYQFASENPVEGRDPSGLQDFDPARVPFLPGRPGVFPAPDTTDDLLDAASVRIFGNPRAFEPLQPLGGPALVSGRPFDPFGPQVGVGGAKFVENVGDFNGDGFPELIGRGIDTLREPFFVATNKNPIPPPPSFNPLNPLLGNVPLVNVLWLKPFQPVSTPALRTELFGFERTFLDGDASFAIRIPAVPPETFALFRQLHPDWSNEEIKALLQNGAFGSNGFNPTGQ
jgi:RHS repeat-associated protein